MMHDLPLTHAVHLTLGTRCCLEISSKTPEQEQVYCKHLELIIATQRFAILVSLECIYDYHHSRSSVKK